MKKLILLLAAVLFFGCSGLEKKTGFSLEQNHPQGVEQPYRALSAEGIKFEEIKTLTAILFPLDTEDCQWIGELGVLVKGQKEGERKLYRREAWRGWVNINGNINNYPYPAPIGRIARDLFLLVPNVKPEDLIGKQAAIFSGASTRAMTPDGRIHKLPEGDKDRDLAQEFFKTHPARIEAGQVVDFSPGTEMGDRFIADIKERFPILLKIGERDLMAAPGVVDASTLTPQDNMIDKIISRGNLPASFMTVLSFFHPLAAGINGTRIFFGLAIAASDEEMKGPYGESNYPGWAVGEVLGYYLKQNHTFQDSLRGKKNGRKL